MAYKGSYYRANKSTLYDLNIKLNAPAFQRVYRRVPALTSGYTLVIFPILNC